ncbi:hypothetical protein BT63DRAFT_459036 [Microthyrium microscopicum]|uniref:GIY-YIG domain-containing protein n=1 Tax=Microthyrium microscopicum TaxID=703497 RepID=A0A6A6TZE3_9PEZI|nr:hypothetical protein BT63DRAFT_459036 [Microthyrium microscopicum]
MPPIPPFYACYLLRSTTKPSASPYIGSTPHPPRRWRQHNGLLPGGAVRTARANYRPWRMVVLVHGFPSSLAALQFEWAWQHAYKSRRIGRDDGEGQGDSGGLGGVGGKGEGKGNGGRGKRGVARSVRAALGDLHALLTCRSFERWPLSVRFLEGVAFREWELWCGRAVGRVREGVDVLLDPLAEMGTAVKRGKEKAVAGEDATAELVMPPALVTLDIGYSRLKPHIEKTLRMKDEAANCAVCRKTMGTADGMICPHENCEAVSHPACLAGHFRGRQAKGAEQHIMPLTGNCPSCEHETDWITLAKELSLRLHAPAKISKILKPPRRKAGALVADEADPESEESDDDWLYDEMHNDGDDDNDNDHEADDDGNEDKTPDDEFLSIDGILSSDPVPPSGQVKRSKWTASQKIVIPDSDWDNVDII